MQIRRLLLTTFALSVFAFAADDPFLGTWKMNTEKSNLKPVETFATFTATSDGYRLVTTFSGHTVNSNLRMDGKDHPVDKEELIDGSILGVLAPETRTIRRINDRRLEMTLKRAGKTVSTGNREVSADGRVMTMKNDGITTAGRKLDLVSVWDKQ